MSRQNKATQFSLLLHTLLFLCALGLSQHAPPVRLPVALDFSILPSAGPLAGGRHGAAQATQALPSPTAPTEKKKTLKPMAKKTPSPAMKKTPAPTAAEKSSPAETVPIAASPSDPPTHHSAQTAAATAAAAGNTATAEPQGTGAAHTGHARSDAGDLFAAGELDAPLAALAKSPPVYPPAAKRRNIEGWIKVKFVVDEQGQVSRVSVLDAKPEGVFEQAVLRCVLAWRFKPGAVGGVAVKALVEQTITFKLE